MRGLGERRQTVLTEAAWWGRLAEETLRGTCGYGMLTTHASGLCGKGRSRRKPSFRNSPQEKGECTNPGYKFTVVHKQQRVNF